MSKIKDMQFEKELKEKAEKPWGFEGTSLRESGYFERGARWAYAFRNSEIERLKQEVSDRNQYKINQTYLDNTHKYYEQEIESLKRQVVELNMHLEEFKGLREVSGQNRQLSIKFKQKLSKVETLLSSGLQYMKEGKRLFTPNTTNSFVDDWIRDVETYLDNGENK